MMLAAPQRPQAEDRERHQRVARASFDHEERDQQERGPAKAQKRGRRSPAGVDGVNDGVDEQRQAGGNGHRAGQIKRCRPVLGAALAQRSRGEQRRDQPDRDVDEQHPAPAQTAGQDPAEQHPGGAAGAGDGAPDPECAVSFGALGERDRDDR